ncbi:class I SAM-dependent methyltransferase [Noviherbaspirillum sp. Root189]|uniref:class I SAM-dependent methyltransferase n=1 Tax=Noviherbaspirillum sp. Root189 TaxID=1736487 RepID=UPI000709E801|nr:class I SAM-dependent methyltransferase [Noviherbaspirillum sp. Root189]KRB84466.1 methylase [Noviherbaspirillum sp. Root189]
MPNGHPPHGASPHKSLLHTPAVQALLLQILSFVVVVAGSVAIGRMTAIQVNVISAAIMQGVLATALSRWRRMASWWLAIQFLFPVALVVLLAFHLPSWIFLSAFLLLLPLYWTTFRTQVPYYPSGLDTWRAVESLIPHKPGVRVVDIGSGFGGLVMHLAQHRPDGIIEGVELAPLPWLASVLRARLRGSSACFIRKDYGRLALSDYDVVFAYLSPAAMPSLWQKARAEMRQGTLLLSLEFPVVGVKPDLILHPGGSGPALYGWYR